ncbi:odorant receptor 67a-like [Drosophila takahashii]|uniref:odorant receptor 67a-like n=1 Tax=Drosophila takahashii TaxID=29030 RepID=UPI001CF892A9|nr:odorant receptor 67a-like [Drosophila takahashii]
MGQSDLIEKVKNVYPTLKDFLNLPLLYYYTVGLEPIRLSGNERQAGILSHIYFVIHLTNLVFMLAMQIIFVIVSFRNKENFVASCEEISYILFIVAGLLKFIPPIFQRGKMSNLVRSLESLFPPPRQTEQEQYDVKKYLKRCHRFSRGFGGLWTIVLVTNSMFALIQYTILKLLHSPNAQPSMPYVELAPWDYSGGWKFYLTYMSQAIAGYTATCGHISADLIIFAATMQAIMHFDHLSRALMNFQVKNVSGDVGAAEEDLRELRSLIAYHNQILGLTDVMNEVFGIPLLVNFVASSILVCLMGFQMTVSINALHMLSLVSPTIEIYLLCSISQMLIDADEERYLLQLLEEKAPGEHEDQEEQQEPQRRKDKWPRREMFDNSSGLQAAVIHQSGEKRIEDSELRTADSEWRSGQIEMTAIAIIASASPGGIPKGHFPLD